MQQEICTVRPVRNPEQEVVATRKENDERQESISDVSSTIANISEDFILLREAPWVRLCTSVVHRAQNDVESEEEEDVCGLSDGWCVAINPRDRTSLIRADRGRIDEIWLYFVEQSGGERQLADQGA